MFYPTYRLALVGIVAVALLALFLVLYRTRIGMIVRAGIEDSVMVDSLGIDVYRVFMIVFGIGAMAAGFAGIVNAPVVSLTPDVGRGDPGADLRRRRDRRRRLVSGRGARRADRRRDHQHHLDDQSRLRLRHAVRGDDAGAGVPALRPARHAEAANEHDRLMLRQRPFLVETLTAIGLIAAPFVLPYLGFAPNTVNRILVWGLFGIGFDILFGYTGLLSFGQSAFYGTGGFVAAYLLTRTGFPYVVLALIIGMVAAGSRRLSGRADRAPAHRHLFRDDHGGDRGGLLFRRVQSAVGVDRRRERVARRADADASISASPRSISPPAGRSISSSRSATSSAS